MRNYLMHLVSTVATLFSGASVALAAICETHNRGDLKLLFFIVAGLFSLPALVVGSIYSWEMAFRKSAVAVALFCLLWSSPTSAACHVQQFHHGHHQFHYQAGHFVHVPYALPVGVPVAVAAPYWYGQASQPPAMKASAEQPAAEKQASTAPPANPKVSAVTQHCGRCHGKPAPDGGLSLKDVASVSLERRVKAVRKILSRQMPPNAKDEPLPPAEVARLIEELTRETLTDGGNDVSAETSE